MTRAEARALGAKTYDDGTPCLHGHRRRYTKSGACSLCDAKRHYRLRGTREYRYGATPVGTPKRIEREPYSTFIAPPTLARLMGGK